MAIRDPATGKFVKGTSGNPGGRPKGLSITALIDNAICESDWLFILDVLLRKARRGDVKAIDMLLDRRFGKAMQPITGKDGSPLGVVINWSDEDGDA